MDLPSDTGPQTVPARTTPTWEMELLVSGATVFGLLQLPALADRYLFGLFNIGAPEAAGLAMPLWFYVKFVLYVLIVTFVLHLCLRGYWVALVGMHSVYPQGVRWDRVLPKLSPYQARQARTEIPSMEAIVEAADNRATKVFGVGFAMAGIMVPPMVLVSLALALFSVTSSFGLQLGDLSMLLLGVVFMGIVLPFGALVMWDRRAGKTAAPDSPTGRRLTWLFRFYSRIGFTRAMNPLLTLYSSQEGGRRTGVLMAVVVITMMSTISLQAVAPRLGWDFGDYRGLPDDRTGEDGLLHPLHYASQRGDGVVLMPPPFIPDPVVRGPYLRLFIPYLPQRHNPALKRTCPDALADESEAGPRARLDCLARLHALSIDGAPVDVPFDAGEDPNSGYRGLVAMIPVRGLAEGRHELLIQPAVHPDRLKDEKATRPFRIPFWR